MAGRQIPVRISAPFLETAVEQVVDNPGITRRHRVYVRVTARWQMMGDVRILLVEDERLLAGAIAEWLRREAFAVDVTHDGDAALERLAVNDYDVLVLDRDIPMVHGDDVCRAVVESGASTRVLMLTAAAAVRDRVAGLAIGADDYLPKPFAFVELSARVHALLRRARPPAPPVLTRAGLVIDPARRAVTRDGRPIALTNKEFALLTELVLAKGAVVSAETLLEKVWDENIDPFSNVVRVTMMKLRRKLGLPSVIETIPGAGYRIP
jgi:DNA-binding response OmpR family regulator